MSEVLNSDIDLQIQHPSVRIVGFDSNPVISADELKLMAGGVLSSIEHGSQDGLKELETDTPFVMPESIGKAIAAKLLGIESVEPANTTTQAQEPSSFALFSKQQPLFSDSELMRQPEEIKSTSNILPKPERANFIKRNAKKIGAVVAAFVFTFTAASSLKLFDKKSDETREITEQILPKQSTTTQAEIGNPVDSSILNTPEKLPMSGMVSPTPTIPEQQSAAVVEDQDPNEISRVVKIQSGRDSWIWNIIQTELTGSYGGVNNSDIKTVRATLAIMKRLAYDNGFGDDTSKLSQLNPGFELKFSVGTSQEIQRIKSQLNTSNS